MRRYWMIAKANRHRAAFVRGLVGGAIKSVFERPTPVDPDVFEQFTRMTQIETRLRRAQKEHGLSTVLLVDLGKNILPYWLAARECGIEIVGVADERLAGFTYRGIPIVNDSVARRLTFDAAVIANTSHVHAERRRAFWRQFDDRPVIDLFEPPHARQLTGQAASGADPAESAPRQTVARSA
jgi:hypothetical protein